MGGDRQRRRRRRGAAQEQAVKRMPHWLYRWLDRRGKIPCYRAFLLLWPHLHFCAELDDALVLEEFDFCDCLRRSKP